MKQVLEAERVKRECQGKHRGRKQLHCWVGEERRLGANHLEATACISETDAGSAEKTGNWSTLLLEGTVTASEESLLG